MGTFKKVVGCAVGCIAFYYAALLSSDVVIWSYSYLKDWLAVGVLNNAGNERLDVEVRIVILFMLSALFFAVTICFLVFESPSIVEEDDWRGDKIAFLAGFVVSIWPAYFALIVSFILAMSCFNLREGSDVLFYNWREVFAYLLSYVFFFCLDSKFKKDKDEGEGEGVSSGGQLSDFKIVPLRTAQDCENALARIRELMDAGVKTPNDELELLSVLVDTYERENINLGFADPIEAIKFRLCQEGLMEDDLIPIIGSKLDVKRVLKRITPLTVDNIRNLHHKLGIPLESLVSEYVLRREES